MENSTFYDRFYADIPQFDLQFDIDDLTSDEDSLTPEDEHGSKVN